MRVNLTIKQGRVKARLSDALNITCVSEARDHLSQILQGGDAYEINLGGITELDTAGVQLLLAVARESQFSGKSCEFVNPSEPVQDAFNLLGLAKIFSSTLSAA